MYKKYSKLLSLALLTLYRVRPKLAKELQSEIEGSSLGKVRLRAEDNVSVHYSSEAHLLKYEGLGHNKALTSF
ncbi:hypothetical protein E2C01_035578 [Portunus trituberculatus]|uniref:Uncharacterized protein n=1 Tax=Portunus trituberculatus TaxID=210409 RepID=A0A5B7FA49_PORTR|nr:hypothetical protein [Portunus trituberculatus]